MSWRWRWVWRPFPQLLGRHLSQAVAAPGAASRRIALALMLVAVFLCGLAPFAVFARVSLAELVQPGLAVAELPSAITEASAQGWLSVCGVQSGSAAEIAAACAKTSGHKGLLRLQDLNFDPDAYVFAVSAVSGVPELVVGCGLRRPRSWRRWLPGMRSFRAILAADAEARRTGPVPRQHLDLRSVALGILLLLGAVSGGGAARRRASPHWPATAWRLWLPRFFRLCDGSLLAALRARPALSPRCSSGSLAAAIYIFGVRLMPGLLFELTGHLSTAAPSAVCQVRDAQSRRGIGQQSLRCASRQKQPCMTTPRPSPTGGAYGRLQPCCSRCPQQWSAGIAVTLLAGEIQRTRQGRSARLMTVAVALALGSSGGGRAFYTTDRSQQRNQSCGRKPQIVRHEARLSL